MYLGLPRYFQSNACISEGRSTGCIINRHHTSFLLQAYQTFLDEPFDRLILLDFVSVFIDFRYIFIVGVCFCFSVLVWRNRVRVCVFFSFPFPVHVFVPFLNHQWSERSEEPGRWVSSV